MTRMAVATSPGRKRYPLTSSADSSLIRRSTARTWTGSSPLIRSSLPRADRVTRKARSIRRRFSSWVPKRVSIPSSARVRLVIAAAILAGAGGWPLGTGRAGSCTRNARSGRRSGLGGRTPRPRRPGVVVETPAALLTQPPGLHHLLEQRRRGEALLSVLLEHDVGDVIGGVQAHEIEQRERPHGVAASELHPLVDVLDRADAFLVGADGVEQVGDQQAVDDKARVVLAGDRLLAQR